MAIELVDAMTKQPGTCLACGGTPTRFEDNKGRPLPSVDLNVDVNWGDNAYLCAECITLIANMVGYEDLDTIQKRNDLIEELQGQLRGAKEQLAEQETDLTRIREGTKAVKKVRG